MTGVGDERLRERVREVVGDGVTHVERLDGGMVGTVRRVDFEARAPVVAKTGDTPLDVEARMLRYLGRYTSLPVPTVEHADPDLLVLSFVEGTTDYEHDERVGRDAATHLAALHDHTAGAFGFPFDTLSGPLVQPNPWSASWIEFFRDQRLQHVAALAHKAGTLSADVSARIGRLADDLGSLLTEPARPALVHGDVWTGNVLAREGRVEAFVDPACYYGHPEVELAYVEWAGAFGEAFFERYRRLRGIDPGFDERRLVYRLLPLLEHLHLFGARYRARLDDTLTALGY